MCKDILYTSHNLAIAIKDCAKEKGVVLKTMLEECGLGNNAMSALYHGKSIAFDSLAKIADYLGCSVDHLLGREDKREFDPQNLVCKPDTYVIAYLDLLGTTEFLEQNKNFNMYETLYRKYKYISSSFNSGRKIKKIEFKVFSDNLIFAIKLGNYSSYSDELQYKLQTLFFIVKSFQLEFLHDYGILLRGGITIGELFIDDIFVLGDGLVKAYNLENNVANFPRVVVDDSILNRIDFVKQISPLIQTLLAKDENDDITYINYLCDISSSEYLKKIAEIVSNKIDYYKNDEKKLIKWLWLQKHINSKNVLSDNTTNRPANIAAEKQLSVKPDKIKKPRAGGKIKKNNDKN